MKCFLCGHTETKVSDSRVVNDDTAIRRRRECLECGFRFSTFEEAVVLDLWVIKRNGEQERYSREKLEAGIKRALQKRSYTSDHFKKLILNIETDIQKNRKNEITSRQIGEIAMKHLYPFDTVAYIRFASVYRSFEDVTHFQQELNRLKEQ